MKNNLFLKKYSGSSELVGKEGPIGILNNLRNNITGYKQKKVIKIKPPKKPEPDYSYVSSIVKDDFNQNKNFVPQLSVQLKQMRFKDNQIYNSIVKNNELNHYYESKNNFASNHNELDSEIVFKKFQNYNNNKNSLLLNNDKKININSKKILPLIQNRSLDINSTLDIIRQNLNKKKSFTPNMSKELNLNGKTSPTKINFGKNLRLEKRHSTLNLRAKNNNMFSNNNINIIDNSNYIHKNANLRNKRIYKSINEINMNKNYKIRKILFDNENKIKNGKRIINDKLNKINNEKQYYSYSYKHNDKANLNYNKKNEYNFNKNINNRTFNISNNEKMKEYSQKEENKLYIINEEKEETKNTNQMNSIENRHESNLLETLMTQRQQYMKNIENKLRLKRYMENC